MKQNGFDQRLAKILCAKAWADEAKTAQLQNLASEVAGKTMSYKTWEPAWIDHLETAITGQVRCMACAANVSSIIIASPLLGRECIPHDGIAYELTDKSISTAPKWIGLDDSLFDLSQRERYLDTPLLHARLLEELAHVWDFRLIDTNSNYSSVSKRWCNVNCDRSDCPKAFDVPNRRPYASPEEKNAEDWALAILWYVFRPDYLKQVSGDRHAFVEALFQECCHEN